MRRAYHLNALLEVCSEACADLDAIRQHNATLIAAIEADGMPDDVLAQIAALDAALTIQNCRADSLERLCAEVVGLH